ncbi:MAG: DUF4405 domain-containing protein [Phycisphaerae bacterium]
MDVALLAALMGVLWTTAVVQFVFPAVSRSAGWTLWRLDAEAWQAIQTGAVAAFALIVLLHLILHWNWVCLFIASRLSRLVGRRIVVAKAVRTLYGVGTLIFVLTLLGAMLMVAELTIQAGN